MPKYAAASLRDRTGFVVLVSLSKVLSSFKKICCLSAPPSVYPLCLFRRQGRKPEKRHKTYFLLSYGRDRTRTCNLRAVTPASCPCSTLRCSLSPNQKRLTPPSPPLPGSGCVSLLVSPVTEGSISFIYAFLCGIIS